MHIKHLYEENLTFFTLKNIIINLCEKDIPIYEKLDGQNLYVSYCINRQCPVYARNKKDFTFFGRTKEEFLKRFTHKGVYKNFQTAINLWEEYVKQHLTIIQQVFEEKFFLNCEILNPDFSNFFRYDKLMLVIHPDGHKYYHNDSRSRMIKHLPNTYHVRHKAPYVVQPDRERLINIYVPYIRILQTSQQRGKFDFIQKSDDYINFVYNFEKDYLSSLKSNYIKHVQTERKRLSNIMNNIDKYFLHEVFNHAVKDQYLKFRKKIDLTKIPNLEGLVFSYGAQTYKLTGYFQYLNKIHGLIKYNKFGLELPMYLQGILEYQKPIYDIGILPGSFKPPHIGHYLALQSLQDCEKIFIVISTYSREHVDYLQSHKIWKIFLKGFDGDVNFVFTKQPIHASYEICQNHPQSSIKLAVGDKDVDDKRYKSFIDKFDVTVSPSKMNKYHFSGANIRQEINKYRDNKQTPLVVDMKKYYRHLSDDGINSVIKILFK